MSAVSRRKGAQGEREVVNYAAEHGIPSQRVIRTATSRDPDMGDVWLWDGRVVVQCKVGKAAQDASQTQLGIWWAETEGQADRVHVCDLSLLVVQRRGVGMARPGEWRAFLRLDELHWWLYREVRHGRQVVEMPLSVALALLGAA